MLKKMKKITALTIVMAMLTAQFSFLGTSAVYAANELESQKTKTNRDSIEFNAYFSNNGNKIHSAKMDIQKDATISLEIVNKDGGYLRDSTIEFIAENGEKANMQVKAIDETNLSDEEIDNYKEYLQSVDEKNNTIHMSQINKTSTAVVEIPFAFLKEDTISAENFSKVNKAKFTGTYVNEKGKEQSVSSEILFELSWTTKPEVSLEQEVSKVIPYDINGNKGVILENTIKTGLKNNLLPIQETSIEVEAPSIKGAKIQDVLVSANSTIATNGDELGYNFNDSNYTNVNGRININVANNPNNNKYTWSKEGNDEYVITYILTSENNEELNINEISSELKTKLTIKTVNGEELTSNLNTPIENIEAVGQMLTLDTVTYKDISKGLIYSNYSKEEKQEVPYEISYNVNIGYYNLTDGITVNTDTDKYLSESSEYDSNIAGQNYIYNKEVRVNKTAFDRILGENGNISIMLNGIAIATMDKDTPVNENNEKVLNIEKYDLNNMEIKVTKPVENGNIGINVTKAIKAETGYSKNEMAMFKSIKSSATIQSTYEGKTIVEKGSEAQTTLAEPVSSAEVFISTDRLSTVVTNENVEIRAILNTNSEYNALYTNPSVDIVLPEYIETFNIKSAKLMFDDELEAVSAEKLQENGRTIIRVKLQGEQTKYNLGATSRGTNISLVTDITAAKLTPNKEAEIQMYYTNDNIGEYANTAEDGRGLATENVKFIAPTGVVTVNSLENYSESKDKISSISGEALTGSLDANAGEFTATASMDVKNNNETNIKNIRILGRTYKTGTKNFDGNDLNTTFDMSMKSPITTDRENGYKIYYSENGEATEDLNDANNQWVEQPESYENIKSYLIVMDKDLELEVGETLSFKYDITIPARLGYNKSAYSIYEALYDNIQPETTVSEKAVSQVIGITTGEGPEVEAKISANVENGAEVKEDDIIEFKITVKNTGKVDIDNVSVSGYVPDGMTKVTREKNTNTNTYVYVAENAQGLSEAINKLKIGESKEFTYYLKVDELDISKICKQENHFKDGKHLDTYKHDYEDYTKEMKVYADIISDKLGVVEVDPYTIVAKKQYAVIKLESKPGEASIVGNKQVIEYQATVKNEQLEAINDTMVKAEIPSGTEYAAAYVGTQYNTDGIKKSGNNVTWNLGTMQPDEEKTVVLQVTANISEDQKEISNQFKLGAKDKSEIESNTVTNTLASNLINISQTCNVEGQEVKEGDKINFILTIKNYGFEGTLSISRETTDVLKLSKCTINQNGVETSNNIISSGSMDLETSTGDTITITTEYDASIQNELDTQVSNKFKVKYNSQELETDTITKTIKPLSSQNGNGNNGENGTDSSSKYRISGRAWLDINGNGERDDSEETISDISVKLVDKSSNNVVDEKTTAQDGTYVFTEVANGDYTLLFAYDTNKYSITTYKATGVSEDKNNDATYVETALDGAASKVGLTDTITVNNASVNNIDIGFIRNKNFDLKLDKYVSKITVKNDTGTTSHDYNNTKLAKKELIGKHLNSTSLVIEYSIVITNEGDVAGYAKKIVDYLPDELQFSSELNSSWYVGNDNNIYNSSLANTVINPGESQTLTLKLTKKMTEENLGLINNKAEIAESYNDLGLEDSDSKAGNKVQGEDDMSSADVLLSVKTGGVVSYISLVIVVLATMGVAIYFIDKKIIRKNI